MLSIIESIEPYALASVLLGWLGQALLLGSVLAVLTWGLVRCLGRRLHPGLQALLWIIVLLKFLVPVGPGNSFSLASLAAGLTELITPLAVQTHDAAAHRAAREPAGYVAWVPVGASAAPGARSETPRSGWYAGTLLCALYLVGVIAAVAVRCWGYRRFAARCRDYPWPPLEIQDIVLRVCRAHGVRRIPQTRVSDDAPAPFVLGILRPTLVLSRRQLLRPGELEAVILHEVAHLRRGDLFVRYLQWVAGTLLFFWPVVAWVNRRIDLAREHVCDEWALRHGRLSAGEYARCLLRAVHPMSPRGWLYRPAAMATSHKTIERRIEMILNAPVHRSVTGTLRLPVLCLILAWAGFALTGAAVADDPVDVETQQGNAQTVTVVKNLNDDGTVSVDVEILAPGELNEDSLRQKLAESGIDLDELKARFHSGDKNIFIQKIELQNVETIDEDAAGEQVRRIEVRLFEELAAFGDEHPNADVNGDGKVSRGERDAYLVAVAMSDPVAFLSQFPNADLDEDGVLEAGEAARFIRHGSAVLLLHPMLKAVHEAPESADEAVGAVWNSDNCQVHHLELEDGHAAVFIHKGATDADSPADWLLGNIQIAPSAQDVASYLPAVEDVDALHPVWIKKVGDGDGTIIVDHLMEIHSIGDVPPGDGDTMIHEVHTGDGQMQTITIHRMGDHVEVEIGATPDDEL